MHPELIFFLFIGIVVCAAVLSYYFDRKRTAAMRAVATSMGFNFVASDFDFIRTVKAFPLFTHGRRTKGKNIIRGNANGVDVTILDYQYTTGSGKNSHTWKQTIMMFKSGALRLPCFALRPESLFAKIGQVFGYQDIDFASNPSFSRQYLLRGEPEEEIRRVFNGNVLSFLEKRSGLSVEGDEDGLLFYRVARLVAPDRIKPLLEEGFGLFSLLRST